MSADATFDREGVHKSSEIQRWQGCRHGAHDWDVLLLSTDE